MSDKPKQCPHCAELLMPEAIICRFCDRGVCASSFKNCPHCSEMIWTAAKYCRYCKSTVENNPFAEWGQPNRKSIYDKVKAETGIHLDDDAIDKLFQRIMTRRPD
ncbi:MAG: hypothetical protein JST44_03905 [Cyanobacteria bacterium SZAS LIN-5]|nr:hypothetical protein [Cyanobacteria bacterium SZAS LIN-5]